jgi:threonine/homoserine/homoserine lactone efflux protein
MSLSEYGTYLVFVILLVIAPGPDTMVVLKNSLAGGTAAGLVTCLGVAAGNLVQGTAVAFGVGALIVRSQPVFDALRIAGVAYLCWLGFQALRSARRDGTGGPLGELGTDGQPAGMAAGTGAGDGRPRARRPLRWSRQGFLSNVTNPKVLAMYLSVLPQFTGRGHGSTAVALALAYTVAVLGLAWQAGLVAAAHRARGWIQRRKVRRALDAVTGTALIGFGIALAAESQ